MTGRPLDLTQRQVRAQARRRAVRADDLRKSLDAVKAAGLVPTALHISPDGSFRWDFSPLGADDELDLEREWQAFEAKHNGHGRA